jgi:uncharacterized UBP type Zn finger protein
MSDECTHTDTIREVTPSALGCEECLKIGSPWVHLRLCRTCGHVGCCDDSPNRHATKHFHQTRHPIIEGYDPPEGLASKGSVLYGTYLATNGGDFNFSQLNLTGAVINIGGNVQFVGQSQIQASAPFMPFQLPGIVSVF